MTKAISDPTMHQPVLQTLDIQFIIRAEEQNVAIDLQRAEILHQIRPGLIQPPQCPQHIHPFIADDLKRDNGLRTGRSRFKRRLGLLRG